MFEHWRKHPTVEVMVAAYLGINKTTAKPLERDAETGMTLFDLGPKSLPFNPVPGDKRG